MKVLFWSLSLCLSSLLATVCIADDIRVYENQVGYRAGGNLGVLLASEKPLQWQLRTAAGEPVARGQIQPRPWPAAGASYAWLTLPELTEAADYQLQINASRITLSVRKNPWLAVHDAALKSYYLNRASMAISPEYAGDYARPAGHADNRVRVHASAASATRPEGTVISAPGGWYDAGDYNKYGVNSGISTYTLLLAYEQFPQFYRQRRWHIPESGAALPDILAEIRYNLSWLLAMQDEDGGVYHKLTSASFNPMEMPDQDDDERYVVQKSTAATLDFAAVMAMASRQYRPWDADLAGQYWRAALKAWAWAKANPNQIYRQPADINTGEYGDTKLQDEWFWAAAELAVSGADQRYLAGIELPAPSVPSWNEVGTLGLYSLALHQGGHWRDQLLTLADTLLTRTQTPPGFTLAVEDFVWGSNAVAMNQAMVLILAARVTADDRYLPAAEQLVHYVLGANATGYSFVTGFGRQQPMHIHHRISQADGVVAPLPGMLVGGPNPGQQDKCSGYPSAEPALSYLDVVCSYSTNEVAINWTAPLVFVLAAFSQMP